MKKTNIGLLEYAKAQIGRPYWYGTYGKIASESLYKSKKKQYPKYYTAKDFASQYGQRVHDCVGLIKGYLWSDTPNSKPTYNSDQDKSARGMYNAAKEKGGESTFPGTPGILVFKTKTTGTSGIHHVGIYDGAGYVYEAKGHAYGVVKTKYKPEDWKYWAQCPYTVNDAGKKVDYSLELRDLKKGCKGEDVRALQILLIGNGYDCGPDGADGDFGTNTDKALRAYQGDHGRKVDGIAGEKTMGSLMGV